MDKEQVLIDYDGLLRDIARKVKVNYYTYEDILQELRMVAILCADKFDESKGTAFSTYLTKSCYYKIKELRMKNRNTTLSLDAYVGEDTTFVDMLEDEKAYTSEDYQEQEEIIEILDRLPYGYVTKMIYIDGKSQIDIAKELGFSKSYINKINRKNLETLRSLLKK